MENVHQIVSSFITERSTELAQKLRDIAEHPECRPEWAETVRASATFMEMTAPTAVETAARLLGVVPDTDG